MRILNHFSIFIFLIKYINSRLILDHLLIKSIKPIFQQTYTESTYDNIYIHFQTFDNYIHEFNYTLFISEINDYEWKKNMDFFKNWDLTNDYYFKKYSDEQYWGNWILIYSGNRRIVQLSNLKSKTIYRIKYFIKSKYGYSENSDIRYFFTKIKNKSDKYVNLYVRGTGKNNHNNSIVKVNDIEILNNGIFTGFALIILDRSSIKVEEVSFYNTYSNQYNEKKRLEKIFFSKNINGTISNQRHYIYSNTTDNNYDSNRLYKKLLNLKEDKIIILVSSYGWEKYFTEELADLLVRYGALNILELKTFMNSVDYDNPLNDGSFINKHYYYHPYAFIGIPNIGPGNGYESFRSNKGHYLSTENLPYAEILIKLKFNKFSRNYYFSDNQYKDKFSYSDDYEYLFNSNDYSLKNLIPFLLYKNLTTNVNKGFYIKKDTEIFYKNDDDISESELERVTLGSGIGSLRVSENGIIINDGDIIENKEYYNYYISNSVKNLECLPPFNTVECSKLEWLDLDIPILKCGIGLSPNICKNNMNKIYLFPGFN